MTTPAIVFASGLLYEVDELIDASKKRILDGVPKTFEAYREEIGHLRALIQARGIVTTRITPEERFLADPRRHEHGQRKR